MSRGAIPGGASSSAFPPGVMGAQQFAASTGSPALALIQGRQVWGLDQTSNERISGGLAIPQGWASVDVDLWWTSMIAPAGGVVRWQLRYASDSAGDDLNVAPTGVTSNVAAPNQYILAVTTLASAIAVTPDDRMMIEIERTANNAADTLAGDAGVLGVRLRRIT